MGGGRNDFWDLLPMGKDWRMRKALRSVSFLQVSLDASEAAGRPPRTLGIKSRQVGGRAW